MSSPDTDLRPIMEPFGPYMILVELAVRPTHRVFLAVSKGTKRAQKLCVVKRIENHIAMSSGFEECFTRAARRLVHLDHRNVAQVFDAGQVDDWFYLAQEYVSGCSLKRLLEAAAESQSAPSLDVELLILTDLLRGVYHALRQIGPGEAPLRLWHGGITEREVLLSAEGEVKIIGFDREWIPEEALPTRYPSECISDNEADGSRIDVYCVGHLLSEMLGDAVTNVERAKEAGLNPRLVDLVAAATSRDLSRRPKDVGMLLRPLRASLHRLNPRCGPPQLKAQLADLVGDVLAQRTAEDLEILGIFARISQGRTGAEHRSRTVLLERDAPVRDRARDRAEAGADDLLGQLPGTRYKILRPIGEGGMGAVYAVEHTDLEKIFALKILHDAGRERDERVEKLRQEAKLASTLRHPNIVAVTDYGETPNGRVFFVMEYLEGKSLAEILEEEGQIEEVRTIEILVQVCEGLAAAHAQGVIHRDVKPENIFVVESPRGEVVKLLDFGVALYIENQQKRSKYVEGTPSYMSPELIRGHPLDGRSDLYSVGIVGYEMLAGRKTFQTTEVNELLQLHLHEEPEPLRSIAEASEVHPALEDLVMRALAKPKEERFANAETMADELRAAHDLVTAAQARDSFGLESERVQQEIEDAWATAFAEHNRGIEQAAHRRQLIWSGVVGLLVVCLTLFAIFYGSTDQGRDEAEAELTLSDGLSRTSNDEHFPLYPVTASHHSEEDAGTPASPPVASDASTARDSAEAEADGPRADAKAEVDGDAPRSNEVRGAWAKRYVKKGYEHFARGQLERAKSEFSKALAIDGGRHDAIAGLGKVAFQQANYTKAESYARRALHRSPRSSSYALDLGAALYRQGRVGEAESLFKRILADNPRNRAAKRYLEAVTGSRD